jgi:predicted nucleotidyltransferase
VIDDLALRALAHRLVQVPGIAGVMLGGSRARGEHTPESDVDLGLYYEPDLDVVALAALARDVAGPDATVTRRGAWGPWVDGGGWLTIAGTPVDWLYRDLARVRESWAAAREGQVVFHAQTGHPLGVPGFSYAGEVALGRVLADPTGQLAALRADAQHYPPALADALVRGLGSAEFLIGCARKAVPRGDATYVAGCLFQVVGICCHALHGRAGRWTVNEKGLVASAGRLPIAPPGFAEHAHAVVSDLGPVRGVLADALERADALVIETVRACEVASA